MSNTMFKSIKVLLRELEKSRRLAGLSQEQTAEALNISRQSYDGWMAGHYKPQEHRRKSIHMLTSILKGDVREGRLPSRDKDAVNDRMMEIFDQLHEGNV